MDDISTKREALRAQFLADKIDKGAAIRALRQTGLGPEAVLDVLWQWEDEAKAAKERGA